jgi:hypothetical protein
VIGALRMVIPCGRCYALTLAPLVCVLQCISPSCEPACTKAVYTTPPSSITSKPSTTAPDYTPVLTTKAPSILNPKKPKLSLPKCPRKQGNPRLTPSFPLWKSGSRKGGNWPDLIGEITQHRSQSLRLGRYSQYLMLHPRSCQESNVFLRHTLTILL